MIWKPNRIESFKNSTTLATKYDHPFTKCSDGAALAKAHRRDRVISIVIEYIIILQSLTACALFFIQQINKIAPSRARILYTASVNCFYSDFGGHMLHSRLEKLVDGLFLT